MLNTAPVADDDLSFLTAPDTSLTIPWSALLANDHDADGDPLAILAVGNAVGGTISLDVQARTVTFTPNAGYTGLAAFTYEISDGHGGSAIAGVALSVGTPSNGPVSLWNDTAIPVLDSVNDPNPIELGVRFTAATDGFVTGIRFYKGATNTGTHIGNLWTAAGAKLASATFTGETASGWQQVTFVQPIALTKGTTYVASYFTSSGNYSFSGNYFSSAYASGSLTAQADGGVYAYGADGGFPNQSYQASNYWVDVVFTPAANGAPVAVADGGLGTLKNTPLVISWATLLANDSDPNGDPFTIVGVGNASNGTVSLDAQARTVTFTPANDVTGPASFTYTVFDGKGGTATAQVDLAIGRVDTGGASFWDNTAKPATEIVDDRSAVELGIRFIPSRDGVLTGLRFYKGATNTGTHIGNLWTAAGAKLASATFTGETASGWQQVTFAEPIALTKGTTYVASYYAPNGHYSANNDFFAGNLAAGPLTATAAAGVFSYGASSFPTQSYRATNYWVDVVFTPNANNIPVANDDGGFLTRAGKALTLPWSVLLRNDTDADADGLSIVDVKNASHGTATLDAKARTVTFTPTSGYTGPADFSYVVSDGAGGTANATVSLKVDASAINPIVAENAKPGNPQSEWDVPGAGSDNIQGFATDISVNRGERVNFKIDTDSTNYRIDIYRLGYYGGMGGRKVATIQQQLARPQNQPAPLTDPETGLVDAGNWNVSASWDVPSDMVSGIFVAKLVRQDGVEGASQIPFIVRNDGSRSDILFQTNDTTWQAYNSWGGNSLYLGSPAGRAYKVSYNRPIATRLSDGMSGPQDYIFEAEYPMLRWLEANGYDVSYTTGVDTDRRGDQLLGHKLFMDAGHDEYWSGGQRASVEAARDAGVNLAFFSGNAVYWKTRWETSIDGSGTPYRTLVTYKETRADAKIDPSPEWTGTWRDPRFSPPSDGGRPENALMGTMFQVDSYQLDTIDVSADDGGLRFWRNTSIADLAPGTSTKLTPNVLGYEWDSDMDNGWRPAGLMRLSETTRAVDKYLLDYGKVTGPGVATHALTLYRAPSGALVFGAGTVRWAWGLDSHHDNEATPTDVRMQQATLNLFADMGIQPATVQADLIRSEASGDKTAPVSLIVAPGNGGTIEQGQFATIAGIAGDADGRVGGVEVSLDGGTRWYRAEGRGTWTYSWVPDKTGSLTILSRATDDSGNIETPGAGIAVNVAPPSPTATSSIWNPLQKPMVPSTTDSQPIELGMKFRSDVNGYVTGVRFYKGTTNTGTHVGNLWTAGGAKLATTTFTNETASGWQQASLPAPVPITAGNTYVVSYHTDTGNYAADPFYFNTDVSSGHLTALAADGANGVFSYGAASSFPTNSFNKTNYWVDVVFAQQLVA